MLPMSKLRSTIEALASQFASNLLGALRGASIDEIYSVASGGGSVGGARRGRPPRSAGAVPAAPAVRRGKGGRLGRRSAGDIAGMVDSIVDLLQKNTSGLRAEQIRDALGCQAKELPRPLADALASGRVTKQGQKRATTYFAGSGGGKRRGPGRAKKKKG